jgi:disulfide bond formation protein DsbB
MHPLIEKSLSLPTAAKLLFLASVGALLFAMTLQFGFGIRPCILCLWERIPYCFAALLTLFVLAWRPFGKQSAVLLSLCAALYLAGAGTAIFHTGVEQHWWQGTDSCTAQPLKGTSPEEIRLALLQTEEPHCDKIPWSVFGLSITNLNVAFSLALAFFSAAVILRRAKNR